MVCLLLELPAMCLECEKDMENDALLLEDSIKPVDNCGYPIYHYTFELDHIILQFVVNTLLCILVAILPRV